MNTTRSLIALALGATFGAGALAQSAGSTAPAPSTTAAGVVPPAPAPARPGTSMNASHMLINSFSSLAGSPENAAALIGGLRSGGAITLTGPAGSGATPAAAATFTAPTKPMGYGNIRIALSLAQAELAKQGITRPTPQQLQTALLGSAAAAGSGPATAVPGILQMRADGMGWGKIAHTLGVKPSLAAGHMDNLTATGSRYDGRARAEIHDSAARGSRYAYGTPYGSRSSGIVTAGGGSFGGTPRFDHGRTNTGVMNAQGSNHRGPERATVGRGKS